MSSTGVDRVTGIDPSVAIKAPCKVIATTNITLSGSQTIDGVLVAETTPKTRVVVNGQTSAINNGIYDVYDTAWKRSTDFNGSRDVVDATLVSVDSGTVFSDTVWKVNANNPVIIGLSSISFVITNNFLNGIQIGTTFGALAFTAASVDRMINIARHTSGTIGGGQFIGVAGSVTNDGGTQINSATVGIYWQRTNYTRLTVEMFGAIRGANDTAAIALACAAASTLKTELHFPAGTYNIIPATVFNDEDTSYITYAAVIMQSNLHCTGVYGESIIKIADNTSTDASPKSIGTFCTNAPLSGVSFEGLVFDGNGANNKISPGRPATYNEYNQSPILVSGTPAGIAGRIDDVLIDRCIFKNNPGVCNICCAQSNTAGVTIGNRWIISRNKFFDNGADTDDHTGVFGWVNDAIVFGNEFINTARFHATGGNTCYEIHGNNHQVFGNKFINYYRGIWVSSNLTDARCENSIITGNEFITDFYGVDFFRTSSALGKPTNTIIENNTFRMDSYTFSGAPTQKVAINITPDYAVDTIMVAGNSGYSTDSAVGSVFCAVNPQAVAGQTHDNITISNNKATGFLNLAAIGTNATNGLGSIVIKNNEYINANTSPAFTVSSGVLVTPTSAIKSLVIDNNQFLDTQGASTTQYGVYLNAGTITKFSYRGNQSVNIGVNEYFESGAVTYDRSADFDNINLVPVFQTSGGAITLGNGVINGNWSMKGKSIMMDGRLTVGGTTVIPAGNLQVIAPYTAKNSSHSYFGSYQLFDASAGTLFAGFCRIDGGSTTIQLLVSGGTFATAAAPVPLAVSDSISISLQYMVV